MDMWWNDLPEKIDPVALAIGPVVLHWYALMWLLAFGSVYALLSWRKRRGEVDFPGQMLSDLLFNTLLGALIGGRLGYVIFYNFGFYLENPLLIISPYNFALGEWTGIAGMSYHGGAIGVAVAFWWTARTYKKKLWEVADAIVPAIGLGYFFGRMGNFFNLELFGRETDASWGMYFGDAVLRHPSQLYEALGEGLLVFAVLWTIRKKKMLPWTLSLIYVGLYGLVRFVVEFYREPDAHIGLLGGLFSMGQLLSIGMIFVAVDVYIFMTIRKKD